MDTQPQKQHDEAVEKLRAALVKKVLAEDLTHVPIEVVGTALYALTSTAPKEVTKGGQP